MGEKRGRPHDQQTFSATSLYSCQQPAKRPRSNEKANSAYTTPNPNSRPTNSSGTIRRPANGPGQNQPRNAAPYANQQRGSKPDKTNQALVTLDAFPADAKKCAPCKLALKEMQTGLAALLDHFVTEEACSSFAQAGPDLEILHHARSLRDLLNARTLQPDGETRREGSGSRTGSKATGPEKEEPKRKKQKTELDAKRPETTPKIPIPNHIVEKLKLCADLPPPPPITRPDLLAAVFTHSSTMTTSVLAPAKHASSAVLSSQPSNYEPLELLGDAYIEIIASRLIYSRFPDLETSQQSFLRQELVKNATLGEFGRRYGFGERLKHGIHVDGMKDKNWNKVIADVFEAYVAGVILSPAHTGGVRKDGDSEGFKVAEAWLTTLWTPQLLSFRPRALDNPRARDDLNVLLAAPSAKIVYKQERDMEMQNGNQCFFMGAYLSGWGYEDAWLGSGEGQNKSAACVRAAEEALRNVGVEGSVLEMARRKKAEVYGKKREEGDGAEDGK